MPELPSGTVTFLFTDIELSTKELEAIGNEAYADALDTHRQGLREAFKEHGGHEVGTEGDAFFVAFASAQAAVQAALDGQRALDGHPLRVRMGIHTGEALVREGDYVGHDVHKAKRVCDAGHGGQVLISEATAQLVEAALVDLGPHRLKDLGEPQRLYQIGPGEFPRLRSLDAFTHSLPAQRSAFIGREKEIAEILELLETNRLVTLTGVGGCGKTRLALQVGAESLDSYPDGVFFADLSAVTDPDVVAHELAGAVGAPLGGAPGAGVTGPVEELLLTVLRPRRCLVIVDNCEHLLDACAELADAILGGCPDVRILATSREGLQVEGEQSVRVPSLSLPENGDAQASEAVSLFKSRARAVRPDFELTPQNVGAVAEICARLDGIPLAIEFAAARVSHLEPEGIASRLDEMFRILTGGRRRVQRQRTLQAALDWSHDLLTEAERALLRRLAVFSGDFGLDAVEGICEGDAVGARDVLDLLGSLVAKSLVQNEPRAGAARYRLLETVRLYAEDRLHDAGEAETYRGRHGDWYHGWVASIPPDDLAFSLSTLIALENEFSNLRAAIEWSSAESNYDTLAGTVASLVNFWTMFGRFEEGFRWAQRALEHEDELSPQALIGCLASGAFMSITIGSTSAMRLAERAVEATAGTTTAAEVSAVSALGAARAVTAAFTADEALAAAARDDLARALDIASAVSPKWVALTQYLRGWTALVQRDPATAFEASNEALPHFDDDDNGHIVAATAWSLATAAHLLGDHRRAVEAAERALAVADAHAHRLRDAAQAFGSASGFVANGPAVALAGAGQVDRARSVLRDSLLAARRAPLPGAIEAILVAYGVVSALEGDGTHASKLFSWVRARTYDVGGAPLTPAANCLYFHYVPLVRQALGTDAARRARDEGSSMSEDEAVALALGEPMHA